MEIRKWVYRRKEDIVRKNSKIRKVKKNVYRKSLKFKEEGWKRILKIGINKIICRKIMKKRDLRKIGKL